MPEGRIKCGVGGGGEAGRGGCGLPGAGRAGAGSGRSFIWALKMEKVGEEQVLTRPVLVSL